jgi:hypothetical protein
MVAVDDLDDTLARLRGHSAQLVDEVVQYEDVYPLCYVRGRGRSHRASRANRLTPETLRSHSRTLAPAADSSLGTESLTS